MQIWVRSPANHLGSYGPSSQMTKLRPKPQATEELPGGQSGWARPRLFQLAACTSQKPHSCPSSHLWPGCPPPECPSDSGIWPQCLAPCTGKGAESIRVPMGVRGRRTQSTALRRGWQVGRAGHPVCPPSPPLPPYSKGRNRGRDKGSRGRGMGARQGVQMAPEVGSAPASLAHLLSGACPSVRPSRLRTAASEGPLRRPRDSRGRTEEGRDGRGGAGRSAPPPSPRPAAPPRSAPARAERPGQGPTVRAGRGRRFSQ